MDNQMQIQWFPGHMAKTRRLIQENIKLVDLIVEICDARIPFSSRNPEMENLTAGKPRIIILNKSDLADPAATKAWCQWYAHKNVMAFGANCKNGTGLQDFQVKVKKALRQLIAVREEKGMAGIGIRIMVVGIPNVGKSSFINRVGKTNSAKVADKPGVTRGKQWVRIGGDMELLDMPGVLWPKFEDPDVGIKLAFTGAVKDQIIDIELLAVRLLDVLKSHYSQSIVQRYKLPADINYGEEDSYELLQKIGKKRGMLISGGEVDTQRAAIMLMDEYRAGKLGTVTLEFPTM